MEPRLAAHVLVGALIRRASVQGDFAVVLKKGDPVSGAIVLSCLIRGQDTVIYEKFPSLSGQTEWTKTLQITMSENADSQDKYDAYLNRRAAQDRDLWLIELDTADQERLTLLLSE